MRLIILNRKLNIRLLFLNSLFLLLILFTLPEPIFRLFIFLLGVDVDLVCILFLSLSFGINLSTLLAYDFTHIFDRRIFYVLVEVHFEGCCQRLGLWDLIHLQFLSNSPLSERILIDGIIPVSKLHLVDFFCQVKRAFWAIVRVFFHFSRSFLARFRRNLKDLCDSALSGLIVIWNFTVAVLIIIVFFHHLSNFPLLVKQLRISTRALFLRHTANGEKFLVCYFFFFFDLVLELHKLLRLHHVHSFRYPFIFLYSIDFYHKRFFTLTEILFGDGFLKLGFISCLFCIYIV